MLAAAAQYALASWVGSGLYAFGGGLLKDYYYCTGQSRDDLEVCVTRRFCEAASSEISLRQAGEGSMIEIIMHLGRREIMVYQEYENLSIQPKVFGQTGPLQAVCVAYPNNKKTPSLDRTISWSSTGIDLHSIITHCSERDQFLGITICCDRLRLLSLVVQLNCNLLAFRYALCSLHTRADRFECTSQRATQWSPVLCSAVHLFYYSIPIEWSTCRQTSKT